MSAGEEPAVPDPSRDDTASTGGADTPEPVAHDGAASEGGCGAENSMSPESCLAADPALVDAGWQLRFIADAPRAIEAVELYSSLGHEVRTEPAQTDQLREECGGCRAVFKEFLMVYTRKA